YVVAYGDMPSLQQAMARAVLGQIDITGKLPISLPGLYPRGTGIQLKAQAQHRTGSGPGSPAGQPGWGGGSDRTQRAP
ncbi:MAG: hypothetical protein M3Q91_15240, partial [Acidobacteriota bacterium]|nr:hypothetical protein [Acidobacteriota bacterium]